MSSHLLSKDVRRWKASLLTKGWSGLPPIATQAMPFGWSGLVPVATLAKPSSWSKLVPLTIWATPLVRAGARRNIGHAVYLVRAAGQCKIGNAFVGQAPFVTITACLQTERERGAHSTLNRMLLSFSLLSIFPPFLLSPLFVCLLLLDLGA